MLNFDEAIMAVRQVQTEMRASLQNTACAIIASKEGTLGDAKTATGQIIGVDFCTQNIINALTKLREE